VLCFTEASAELHLPLPTGKPLPPQPGQHVKQNKQEYDVFKLVIKPGDFKTKLSDFLESQGLDPVAIVSALGTIEQLCGQQNIGNETLEKALTQILKNPNVMGLRLIDSKHFHALVPRAAATTK
jgi:ClpP class serine protease